MSMMGITLNFMSTMAMGLVAGVLVDDAIVEIENIVRHMRMGKSAYQASLDAADEIGLAVLATTMAIVAVFLPGRADARHRRPVFQGVRLHRRAVGADELARRAHDHAADRRLFPALARRPAARRLEVDGRLSEGAQLEPRHVEGACAARAGCRRLARGSAITRSARCSLLLVLAAFVAGTGACDEAGSGKLGVHGAISFVLALARRRAVAYGARQAASACSSQQVGSAGFARVARRSSAALECAHARPPDGDGRRRVRDAAAQHRACSAPCRCPSSRRRTATIRAVNITMPPGSTLKQTEAVADRVAAIVGQDPNVERVFERINVGERPRQHRAQEGPPGHEHRVRAQPRRRRSPRSPTRASASRARTAAGPTATRATSCSTSAATTRCS